MMFQWSTEPIPYRGVDRAAARMGSQLGAEHASRHPCHPHPPRDRRVARLALQRRLGLLPGRGTWNDPHHPSHSRARWRHLEREAIQENVRAAAVALGPAGERRTSFDALRLPEMTIPPAAKREAVSSLPSDARSSATVCPALRVDRGTPVSTQGPSPCPRPPPARRRA